MQRGQRNRLLVLAALLAVVAGYALYNRFSRGGLVGETSAAEELRYSAHNVPRLETAHLRAEREDRGLSRRNPFTFGAPPTPTPNLTPRPTPVPRVTMPPRTGPPTPTPRTDGLPPPPRFDRQYLGYLGPERLPIAVFRKDGEVEVAVPGDVLDGKFILRGVGFESVEIGFVGYSDKEKTSVPLAEN
jgi:hypothetical protein